MRFDADALDRAILAMPLEDPPPDLRAQVLAATIYRPAPMFTPFELVAFLGIFASAIWLAIAMFGRLATVVAITFSNTSLAAWLAWSAVGAGATIALFMLSDVRGTLSLAKGAKQGP
jgi:hypothetical protein